MLSKATNDTKEKIMQAAFELFGRFGFEGTSIRDIAQESGVNLAAINYHFKNKENLFWEIMAYTYKELELEIKTYSLKSKNTTELALHTFDYFLKEKIALKNVMKMMLAEGITPPDSVEVNEVMNNPMGPPGGIYFAELIQKEIPYKLSREGLLWGVKAVFGVVTHWGMMCSTDHICGKANHDPLMTPEQIRRDVENMIRGSLMYLKQNEILFKQSDA